MTAGVGELSALLNCQADKKVSLLQQRLEGEGRESVAPKIKDKYAIWTREEVEQLKTRASQFIQGTRQVPLYEVKYRQNVSAEDMFLGMGGKVNSMSHADELAVYLELPLYLQKQQEQSLSTAEILDEIEIDVQETSVKLYSPLYAVSISLPQSVDPKKSRAAWDSKTGTMTVRTPVVNPFLLN